MFRSIQASPVRGSSHPALSLAASLNGGKRFGTRVASRCDSFCASFATQKKGDASHDAGAGRVACAIPMTRQVVPASSALGEGAAVGGGGFLLEREDRGGGTGDGFEDPIEL